MDIERYHVIENFYIPQLGRTRTIRIYLPQGYINTSRSYPVIYMHDGQNLFDNAISYSGESWQIAETVDQFFSENDGAIIVGIDNGAEYDGLCRMYEYSPWQMDQEFFLPDWPESVYQTGGEGAKYIEFITDTLKPYIDCNFRTSSERESTIIAGSSMGGFISLYGILHRPDIFSGAGVFSPAFWFNKPAIFAFICNTDIDRPVKIYMDMGTQESSGGGINFEKIYLDGSNEAEKLLKNKLNVSMKYIVDEGAQHTESAWANRYPQMLDFLFN